MPIDASIIDGGGRGSAAHVHEFNSSPERDSHEGLITLSEPLAKFDPEVHPFLNTTFGNAMNQNVTFGTIPAIINNGGTTANRGTGNADSNVTDKLIDGSGTPFNDVVAGMSVENTDAGTYANVVTVEDNNTLLLDDDIFPLGTEAYAVDAAWVGTAVQGAWNFADSGKITLTAGNNGDEASLDANVLATYVMSNFTALTGKIDLDTYDASVQDFLIQFDLNGVAVGNSVLLNGFIDTSDFTEQTFVIPKAQLGLNAQTVNGLTIQLIRLGGPKPTVKFDDIQLEASGTPAVFTANALKDKVFCVTEIRISIADNITGITTVAGATENATVPNLSYDKLMALSALTNGILFQRVQNGKVVFSVSIKQLSDFLGTGSMITNHISDGTNTYLTLIVTFPDPIVLDGVTADHLSFTISDDLSGLLIFNAVARGSIKKTDGPSIKTLP